MPLQKLQLRPGLNREGTDYANEGGWYDGDKIRFRSGFPEKLGGWIRLSAYKYLGIARSLWAWSTLAGFKYLGLGTNLKYYIESSGQYYDITPITNTITYNNAISTGYTTLVSTVNATATTISLSNAAYFVPQSGIMQINTETIYYSTIVSNVASGCVRGYANTTAASHTSGANISSGYFQFNDIDNISNNKDFLILSNSTAVGSLSANLINQEHQIFKYGPEYWYALNTTTDNNLSNLVFTNALIDAGGGNNITVNYEVPSGLPVYTSGLGWGASYWNRGTWGSAATVGIGQQLRLWTNDNFGQDLVFAPRGGQIYYWQANFGTSYRGLPLSQLANTVTSSTIGEFVPQATNQVISSAIQRFVIAFGANSYDSSNASTSFNSMLVRWSDQENPYNWVPDITNQAGEFTLTNGSFIMQAQATRQEILVWTDTALYSMQYLGPPYIWGFNILMDNISIMSPNSAVTVNNITYWMGTDKFYRYSGRVETLPCALRQYIFDDINTDQSWQVYGGSNEGFNEVWWFYVSNSSGGNQIDKYVIYNYLDNVWYYGNLNRNAWLNAGQNPLATFINGADVLGNPTGNIIYHEVGADDGSGATTVPITSYVQSSDFDLGDGEQFSLVWRVLPDVNFTGSTVNNPSVTMQLLPRQNSGSAYGSSVVNTTTSAQNYANYPQYTIQQFTGQVYTRLRGRQMAMVVGSNGMGVAWQLGAPRIDLKPDGRR